MFLRVEKVLVKRRWWESQAVRNRVIDSCGNQRVEPLMRWVNPCLAGVSACISLGLPFILNEVAVMPGPSTCVKTDLSWGSCFHLC